MNALLFPTPFRRALLDDIAADQVHRVRVLSRHGGREYDLDDAAGRRVTDDIRSLEQAGWVTLPEEPPVGRADRRWKLTDLGDGIRQIRIMHYGRRVVAETGPDTDPTVIGNAERYEGIPGRWLVDVGTEQFATHSSVVVATLCHLAACAVMDLPVSGGVR